MGNLLTNFDAISFWLGFLTATLLWWMLGRLRPELTQMRKSLQAQAQATRQERSLSDEIRLGNDTLRLSQEWHLAAPLFSLDEILIPPRLLAPAPPPLAYELPQSSDITDWAIPYLSDWPELASFYRAPSLDPLEALQGGANLAIIGEPGSGKTVALAYIAGQLIRSYTEEQRSLDRAPILVHAADLVLPPEDPKDTLGPLVNALTAHTSSIPAARLPKTIQSIFRQKRALLMVDGLDELAPSLLDEICNYLRDLLRQFPGTQAVVAASTYNLGRLLSLRFTPIPLASWDQDQRAAFIIRWSELWNRFVASMTKPEETISPLLLVGWLFNNTAQYTPLELTLKVWAAFAGDSIGPSPMDAIEAYLRRMVHGQPDKNRPGFEQLASQMVLAMEPVVVRRVAENWLAGRDALAIEAVALEQGTATRERPSKPVVARGALPDLLESGLITPRGAEKVSIAHPVIAGYLASHVLLPIHAGEQLVDQPDWTGKITTLLYLAIQDQQAAWISTLLQDESIDPVLRGLLTASRWLRGAPAQHSWVSQVMRQLVAALHNENLTIRLKARVLTALVLSGKTGVAALMRQLLSSPQSPIRQLAALGCGMLRDRKAIGEINKLFDDPSPGVSRAVLLSLIAIGDRDGMDTVAYALLHGDEGLRQAAAEALANHPEEGHPTLKEGSTLDDPAVRRATVFGLGRIRQPWAIQILEKLRTEDPQWIVQDAASQVLDTIQETNPCIPRPLPSLAQTAWLIAFAAELGMGVAPGKPAYDLLYKALQQGTEDEILAALYYLSQRGDERALLPLYQTYFSSTGDVREAAFDALWNLAATGVTLPPPIQYGLK